MPKKKIHIALISMPWAIFNRPSIQLGSLKAYLEKNDPDIHVDCFHPYLAAAKELGGEIYQAISLDPWLCEALYSPIIFPEQLEKAGKFAIARLKKNKNIKIGVDTTIEQLRGDLDNFIKSVEWRKYSMIGFSVCFNQLTASLAAAKNIKAIVGGIPIVFGGSQCVHDDQNSLTRKFHFIDTVVYGEGEASMLSLCGNLKRGRALSESTSVSQAQIADLEKLPPPDYGDYFRQQEAIFKKMPFIPVLPVEFSRGCWWGKCTFCNLNLQWCGYRAKSADQMYDEIHELSSRHATLDFCLTDNVLPVKQAKIFFEKLARQGRGYTFFGEVRADQRKYLPTFRRGGLTTIQAGIESFSNSLLKKFRKGVSVIENLAVMKTAQSCGMKLEGNLIIRFPGTTAEEVEETLQNLDFALPYQPLKAAAFFLGYGSAVFEDCRKFGIRDITRHPNYSSIFPKEKISGMKLLIQGYRGDTVMQKKLWRPVEKKISAWEEFHEKRLKNAQQPPLLLRDGDGFVIIRQEQNNGTVLQHRLQGMSASIYLACDEITSISALAGKFTTLPQEEIVKFLDDLVRKRLMFREGKKYLALAVRMPLLPVKCKK